jgi:hypothetical protein
MTLGIARSRRRYFIALSVPVALLVLGVLHKPAGKGPAADATVVAPEPAGETRAIEQPAGASSAAQAGVNESRRADLLAATSIREIASVIRDHIARSPRYAELAKCDPVVSLPCRELLSQAIYEAMDLKVMRRTRDGELGIKALTKQDDDAIFDTVGRVLVESTDSVERASALMLLRSMPSMRLRPLPDAAYRNISERTVAEGQLTLQQPIGGPLPYTDVARELVTLFTNDRDSRLQESALSRLAYPETEPELLAAVRDSAGKHDADWPGWRSSVAAEVGPCGMACIETVEAVLDASGDEPAVAEEILRSFPEKEQLALTEHLKGRFEPKVLLALVTSVDVGLAPKEP